MSVMIGRRTLLVLFLLWKIVDASECSTGDESCSADLGLLQKSVHVQEPVAATRFSSELAIESERKEANDLLREEVDDLPSFESYISKHGRTYSSGSLEYGTRKKLFDKRVAEVKHQNSRPDKTWTAAVNHLTDRTEEELARLRGWRGVPDDGRSTRKVDASRQIGGDPVPGTVSFAIESERDSSIPANILPSKSYGYLKAIKRNSEQGTQCGSCWAITTATIVHAAQELYTERGGVLTEMDGPPPLRSAQELVDCVPNDQYYCGGTGGCNGASVELALKFIEHNVWRTEAEHPYVGKQNDCWSAAMIAGEVHDPDSTEKDHLDRFNESIKVGAHKMQIGSAGRTMGIDFWHRLPRNDTREILIHLYRYGPVAAAVASKHWAPYKDGVFNSCEVNAIIDHSVVVYGYGEDAALGLRYWEIKNSWGPLWGREGNMRLLRETEDVSKCGVNNDTWIGVRCKYEPRVASVCGQCGILEDIVSIQMVDPYDVDAPEDLASPDAPQDLATVWSNLWAFFIR